MSAVGVAAPTIPALGGLPASMSATIFSMPSGDGSTFTLPGAHTSSSSGYQTRPTESFPLNFGSTERRTSRVMSRLVFPLKAQQSMLPERSSTIMRSPHPSACAGAGEAIAIATA